ncbi:CAP domain-containing protein [Desarmillaria tabescens]|uniref:CAP domain-containing protein n=1 Tax=Armillaria tabescens TaxID=1929756 RepID=A0AA39NA32_ARMTA|nr:CAP domain-containing protein [Desarmillaria tabescens]KAK0461826.1 CAP domain-containing protein [Desarmillaria tabescens]
MIFIAQRSFLIVAVATILSFLYMPVVSAHLQRRHASRRDTSWSDAYTFLSAHNAIRIQHGANLLTWSYTLADAAQSWVNQCEFRATDGQLFDTSYGEIIVAGSGDVSIETAINSFVADEADYTDGSDVLNHFTQVVWKSTTELGCARNTACNGIFDNGGSQTLVVCLYDPAGNVIGEATDNVQV